MVARIKIILLFGRVLSFKGIYYNELDFHFFGNNALDIYACLLTDLYPFPALGKTCEVRGELNKRSIIFDASYNSRYSFARRKALGVLLPRAEQLLLAEAYSAVFNGLYDGFNLHSHAEALPRMFNPRDRD